jgi:multidrug efflux pump subunit AcrB
MIKPLSLSATQRNRFNLSRLAIQHAWLTIGFWIVVTVAGLFAFSSLKYALFPDITFPVVVVNATASLETALDTEAQLTRPLEAQLQPLPGLNDILSTTYPGRTVANLRFKVGTDLAANAAAVEQALSQTDLAAEAKYQVIPLNLNEEAAVSYAIVSPDRALSDLAEVARTDILPMIEAMPGVLRVDLLGASGQASNPSAPSATADTLQNPPTLIRFNGQDSLAFQVIKRGDANTLELVSQVEAAIAQIDLPDVQLLLAATQADYIREATQSTIDSLLLAIVISVAVIFGFLRNWRATLITALAIPISLLGTCIVMALAGFNFETITLLALALVIGIIVDDAIVEVENIIRHIEHGASPRQAALAATQEIGLTVSAATLTIVAVFLPVALMGGTIGQFFKPFGLTVSAAVLTSLLVARTLSPVLAVYWLRPSQKATDHKAALAAAESADTLDGTRLVTDAPPGSVLEKTYDLVLAWALNHRGMVIGIAIASFIAGSALMPLIPQGFIPKVDRGEFNLTYTVALPSPDAMLSATEPGLSAAVGLDSGPAAAAAAEPPVDPLAALLAQSRQVAVDLETSVRQIPEVESVFTTVGLQGKPNQGKLYLKLNADRQRDTAAVQDQIRKTLPTLAGVTTSVEDIQFVDTGGEKPLQVVLIGEDLVTLDQAAQALKTRVQALPEFADVRVTGAENTPEQILEINHQNGSRVAYLSANLSQGQALGEATDEVVAIAKGLVPAGVSLNLGSDSARLAEVLGSFGKTLTLSVLCMVGVLLIPFGRLLEPMVVVLSLPLAMVGAMLALLVTRSDFGMISVIGLIFLLGLLDKNALLLMDYINQLRKTGLNRTEAILKTGLVRLRPILMTTASTILGMLPIALGIGAGAELRQPMAVAIFGGLVTSTLLSLIVVPVLYTLLEDWGKRRDKLS